jgi:hypothetical protein
LNHVIESLSDEATYAVRPSELMAIASFEASELRGGLRHPGRPARLPPFAMQFR